MTAPTPVIDPEPAEPLDILADVCERCGRDDQPLTLVDDEDRSVGYQARQWVCQDCRSGKTASDQLRADVERANRLYHDVAVFLGESVPF